MQEVCPSAELGAICTNLENLQCLGLTDDDESLKRSPALSWHTTRFARRFLSACSEQGKYWYDHETEKFVEQMRGEKEDERRLAELNDLIGIRPVKDAVGSGG